MVLDFAVLSWFGTHYQSKHGFQLVLNFNSKPKRWISTTKMEISIYRMCHHCAHFCQEKSYIQFKMLWYYVVTLHDVFLTDSCHFCDQYSKVFLSGMDWLSISTTPEVLANRKRLLIQSIGRKLRPLSFLCSLLQCSSSLHSDTTPPHPQHTPPLVTLRPHIIYTSLKR